MTGDDKPPCGACKANCCHNIPMSKNELKTVMAAAPRRIEKWQIKSMGNGDSLLKGRCPWGESAPKGQ